MDQKFWVNKGERAFEGDVYRALDKRAAARGGVHVIDCAFFTDKDGGWTNSPVSIYYAGYRPESGFENRYFGLNFNYKACSITIFDADRIEEIPFIGLLIEASGEFVFSRWRRDFRSAQTASVCVDGGLDYFRAVGSFEGTRRAVFGVRDGQFVEIT